MSEALRLLHVGASERDVLSVVQAVTALATAPLHVSCRAEEVHPGVSLAARDHSASTRARFANDSAISSGPWSLWLKIHRIARKGSSDWFGSVSMILEGLPIPLGGSSGVNGVCAWLASLSCTASGPIILAGTCCQHW